MIDQNELDMMAEYYTSPSITSSKGTPTAPVVEKEEQEPIGILGTAGDMIKGVGEGAVKAVEETVQFGADVINWFDKMDGSDDIADVDIDIVPDWLETKTTAGKMVSGVSQFLTGFVGAGKVLKATKLANGIIKLGKGAKYINGVVQGAIADAVVFDPHEERLSNLINTFPALENPVTTYLAADPTDSSAEGRFKNALEGLALGGLVDAVVAVVRGVKARALAKNVDEFIEATIKTADEVDEALKGATKDTPAPEVKPNQTKSTKSKADGITVEKTQSEQLKELGMTPTKEVAAAELREQAQQAFGRYKFNHDVSPEDMLKQLEDVIENGRTMDVIGYTGNDMFNIADIKTDEGKNFVQAASDATAAYKPDYLAYREHWSDVEQRAKAQAMEWAKQVLDPESSKNPLFDRMNVDATVADRLSESIIIGKMAIEDGASRITDLTAKLNVTEAGTASAIELERQLKNTVKNSLYIMYRMERLKTGIGRALNIFKDVNYDDVGFDELLTKNFDVIENATSKEIKALGNRLSAVADDSVKYAQTLKINKNTNKFWALHNEYWMNSVLSGPTTHAVNVIANAIKAAVFMPLDKIAGGWGGFKGGLFTIQDKELFEEGINTWRVMYNQIGESMKMAGISLKTGENLIKGATVIDNDIIQNAWSARTFNLTDDKLLAKPINLLGKILNLPKKFLIAEDEFFAQLVYRSKTQLQLEKVAKRMIAEGKMPNDPKAIAEFVADNFDKAFIPKKLLSGEVISQGIGVYEEAAREAMEATFTAPLRPKTIAYRFNQMANEHPWIRPIVPFIKTPTNIMRDLGQHTPFVAQRMAEYTEAMAKGGSEAAKAQGRVMVGGLMWSLGIMAAMNGNITGGGPKNKVQREALMATGWRPYSIKIGDKYVSYGRIDPFAMFLGISADWAEIAQHADEKDLLNIAGAMLMALPKNLASKTYLKGLVDTLNAITYPEQNGAWVVKQRLLSYIPAFLAQTARSIDPEMKETAGLIEAAKAKIPGLSSTLPAQYSWISGKPILYHGGIASGLSPIVYSSGRKDLEVLAEEMGKRPRAISQPPKKYKGIEFTSEQYSELCRLHGTVKIGGKTMEEALVELFNSQRFDRKGERYSLDEDPISGPRAAMMREVVERYRKRAINQLMRDDPTIYESIKQVKREKALSKLRSYAE